MQCLLLCLRRVVLVLLNWTQKEENLHSYVMCSIWHSNHIVSALLLHTLSSCI
ncbi:hypothetical protein M758_6G103000 [Ceratodon purpureus]|uniref:Uncharacterized protein n=1 Tax=Ceratodon purpureus TaxID=3225 RepID=A0A8T0HH41_CERPU|nr:hypothetical protein KC19_6G106700 [Ceratodon purpureus]KAG0613445.1 hypothetical protein M758_6G103000 [Ceratodon purpureus]